MRSMSRGATVSRDKNEAEESGQAADSQIRVNLEIGAYHESHTRTYFERRLR
jgi:hypothetical protein